LVFTTGKRLPWLQAQSTRSRFDKECSGDASEAETRQVGLGPKAPGEELKGTRISDGPSGVSEMPQLLTKHCRSHKPSV